MFATRRFIVYTAGPNTALIKSSGKKDVKIVIGGRLLAIPIAERVDTLSLTLRTLTVHTPVGLTINGVAVDVTSACQVKIQGWAPKDNTSTNPETASKENNVDESTIRLAAQHFIGKTEDEINETIEKTVAGHQRAIIGTLTVEQLYSDRAMFCQRVLEHVTLDLRNMGLAIVSYTVAEIADDQGYIDTLAVRQTEVVKREAAQGAALHNAQARKRVAETGAEAHVEANRQTEQKVISDRDTRLLRVNARENLNRMNAVRNKAFEISSAEQEERLLVRSKEADAARAEAGLAVGRALVKREVLQKEKNVNVEADAKLYQSRLYANAVRTQTSAEAERVRLLGEADAEVLRLKGLAEADVLKRNNRAWQETGNPGAVLEKVIDVLPEVARELSKPLQKTENMVFVCDGGQHGGSENMSIEDLDDSSGGYEWGDPVNDFTKLVAELPETVGAIADVDLVAAFENLLSGRSGDAIVQGAAEGTATGLVDLLFARS